MGNLPKRLGKLAWKGLRTFGLVKVIRLAARGYVRFPSVATVRSEMLDAADDVRQASMDTSRDLMKIRLAQEYVRNVGDERPISPLVIFAIVFGVASPFVLVGFGFLSSAIAWQYYQATQDAELAMNGLMLSWGIIGGLCILIPTAIVIVLSSRMFWSWLMWKIVRVAKS